MKLKKHSETDFLNLDNCLNHKLLTKDNGDNSVPNKNSDKYKLNFNKNTKQTQKQHLNQNQHYHLQHYSKTIIKNRIVIGTIGLIYWMSQSSNHAQPKWQSYNQIQKPIQNTNHQHQQTKTINHHSLNQNHQNNFICVDNNDSNDSNDNNNKLIIIDEDFKKYIKSLLIITLKQNHNLSTVLVFPSKLWGLLFCIFGYLFSTILIVNYIVYPIFFSRSFISKNFMSLFFSYSLLIFFTLQICLFLILCFSYSKSIKIIQELLQSLNQQFLNSKNQSYFSLKNIQNKVKSLQLQNKDQGIQLKQIKIASNLINQIQNSKLIQNISNTNQDELLQQELFDKYSNKLKFIQLQLYKKKFVNNEKWYLLFRPLNIFLSCISSSLYVEVYQKNYVSTKKQTIQTI